MSMCLYLKSKQRRKMLNFLYKVLLTFNSTSWVIVLFGVNQEWTLLNIPSWVFSLILLTIPILMSLVALFLTNFFGLLI